MRSSILRARDSSVFCSNWRPTRSWPVVRDAARSTGHDLVGLQFEQKTEESLARKIEDRMGQGMTREEAQASIADSLRYTMTTNTDEYTAGYFAARSAL